MRKTSFSIKRCRVHGALRFCVTTPRADGPGRIRRFFTDRESAENFLTLRKREAAAHGVRAFTLSEQDRADYLWSAEQLGPYGLSVREAVESLLPQLRARENSLPVEDAIRRFIESKKAAGLSARHLYEVEIRLNRFAASFAGHALATFTAEHVETWLNALPVGPQTTNHFRACIHSLFAYGARIKACSINPVEGIDARKVVRGAPSILSAAQLRALLMACRHDPELCAYLAIGALAGLRSAETARLQWEHVNLMRGFITVSAENAKTSRRRLVPICDALRAWLSPIAKQTGSVGPQTAFRRRFHDARKTAGLADLWEGNELRHSYATYRLAETQDAAKVALEMGNSPSVLLTHYRELATPEDAAAWFAVKPQAVSNVVPLAA